MMCLLSGDQLSKLGASKFEVQNLPNCFKSGEFQQRSMPRSVSTVKSPGCQTVHVSDDVRSIEVQTKLPCI